MSRKTTSTIQHFLDLALPCATVVGVNPRRESLGSAGKKGPLEWTETSGGLWEWWHDPGVPLGFPVESASS